MKKKPKILINNKMKKGLGSTEFKGNKPTGRIEINVKKHKGDRAELASTIKHEMMHVKYPKMPEKKIYNSTAKTKIPRTEQESLIAKLRTTNLNHKTAGLKRKFKMGTVESKPAGDFITKMNELKDSNGLSKRDVAIHGLV